MMNRFILTFTAVLAFFLSNAQSRPSSALAKTAYSMPSRDYVMLQFGYDNWTNLPDSIKVSGLGRAFNAYLCYDFPIMKSNFSFAAGAGIGSSSIYLKDQQIVLTDTSSSISFIPETQPYKKYKLATSYIEAPFEIRYFSNKDNRNKGVKVAIGLKVGTLLSSHTKGKRTFNNKPIIEKVNTNVILKPGVMRPLHVSVMVISLSMVLII
ncbi:hypothetical protein EMGBS15_13880 [Filimonas sp.]|nr:hypothetical protein EMGBS15_13880 [Filimonas sp.]